MDLVVPILFLKFLLLLDLDLEDHHCSPPPRSPSFSFIIQV